MHNFNHDVISIGCPDGWSDLSTVTVAGPSANDYSPNITITREHVSAEVELEHFAKNELESLKRELTGSYYAVLDEGSVSVNGIPAYQSFHSFVLEDEEISIHLEQWQIYIQGNGEIIVITCTDRADNFERSYPTFVEAVNQFQYRG